jgi:putative peptide zinc metalloprotease protein
MTEISRTERVLGPLRVGLRSDLSVTRQQTRGGVRYVVHDPVSFQNHAFQPSDYRVLTAIVRQRTLRETIGMLVDQGLLDDTDEDRQGFFKFVLWLHNIGLVHLPITGGNVAFDRMQQKQLQRRGPWYRLLMSHRIPIGDPNAFLDRTIRFTGWLFAWPGLLLWLALIGLVFWKCLGRFDAMFAETSNLLSIANLPVLWIALVLLKILHEFGHAYAAKKHGANIPEMGVQMIMLTPCAYVDASASWQLPGARQRAIVALGGMYAESFVAAIAALVWAGTTEGFAHDLAFNVIALASVVTVLFNINPLMKYDGYFLFSDLVGVFNLQQRAQAYFTGWTNRIALGKPRMPDRYTWSERVLYATYGPAAFVYRVTLAFVLTGLMTMQWPSAGMFLGAVFAWALIVRPLVALLVHLWRGKATAEYRTHARLVALGALTLAPLIGSLIPISWNIVAPGVLDPQERQSVRAPSGGFVRSIDVANGAHVDAGDRLCLLQNPDLEMRRLRLIGELDAESEGLDAIELDDPTQAAIHQARISYLTASVRELDQRIASLRIAANTSGTIASPVHDRLAGRFLQQGEELFQVHSGYRFLRIVLTEEEVSRARLEVNATAMVRWTCDPTTPVAAVVRDIHASASRLDIPVALTMLGGGDLYVTKTADSLIAGDRPYLHVLLEVESIPLNARGSGLTARVQLPARVQLLGDWVQHRLLSFWNAWRMS